MIRADETSPVDKEMVTLSSARDARSPEPPIAAACFVDGETGLFAAIGPRYESAEGIVDWHSGAGDCRAGAAEQATGIATLRVPKVSNHPLGSTLARQTG
jgi:hypothetical protein